MRNLESRAEFKPKGRRSAPKKTTLQCSMCNRRAGFLTRVAEVAKRAALSLSPDENVCEKCYAALDDLDLVFGSEPRVRRVVESALKLRAQYRETPAESYDRINAYYYLKSQASSLVGWGRRASTPQGFPAHAFDIVMTAIIAILPPDQVDLYPEGESE
jgi:hypothetical protein